MHGLGAPNLELGPTTTLKTLVDAIDAGTILGTCEALRRIRRTNLFLYVGVNGLGDQVFNLGQLPRERGEKRLYISRFAKPASTGALFRAYVQHTPV